MNLSVLSLTEARKRIREDAVHASDLADACLRQIDRLNPLINAFITVITLDSEETKQTTKNLLNSIPIAVKDLYETKGIRTTAGSKFFSNYIPEQDAYVVQKLKEAGAVIIGKTNTHEIALGVTNNNPHYGACKNPWDTKRITGGSSGGSAAAVAADMCIAAVGTDTGGSIRIPASLCGVVGLKPTYGRVSLRGIIPLSWNLDHAGPITKTVGDAALMLQVMAGYDPLDPASVKMLPGDFASHLKDSLDGRTIALATGDYIEASDPEVMNAVCEAAKVFESLGAKVKKVEISWLRNAALANGLMTTADGAAYHRERLKEHPDWFGEDVRQRLEMGAAYTSTEYALARRTQAEARREAEVFFESHELLLLPTTPISAPLLEGDNAVERARQLTRFTAPFNLTGLPALSLPCGFTQNGLPIGLQIVSRPWNEVGILRAGLAYENGTDWRKSRPNLNM